MATTRKITYTIKTGSSIGFEVDVDVASKRLTIGQDGEGWESITVQFGEVSELINALEEIRKDHIADSGRWDR